MNNAKCKVLKEGLNMATLRPWWVIRTTTLIIAKGIKIEPGTLIGYFQEKEQAMVRAKELSLEIVHADRDM